MPAGAGPWPECRTNRCIRRPTRDTLVELQRKARVRPMLGLPVRSAAEEVLLQHMSEALRLSSLALFAVGPVVAVLALLRRGLEPSPMRSRIRGWRWYVPAVLLPAEWLLPPILIALRIGEIEVGWLPVRVVGLAVGLAGAVLLAWSSVVLGRFMIHEAAVRDDHALVSAGPYRFVRHPVYALSRFAGCVRIDGLGLTYQRLRPLSHPSLDPSSAVWDSQYMVFERAAG